MELCGAFSLQAQGQNTLQQKVLMEDGEERRGEERRGERQQHTVIVTETEMAVSFLGIE